MADNLIVGFGVDDKGLTASINVIKAQLRGLQKDVKVVSDEFLRTGDPTQVNKTSEAISHLTGQLRALQRQQQIHNQELKKTNLLLKEQETLAQKVGHQFGEFAQAISPIAGTLAQLRGGLVGLAVAEAIKKVADTVNETANNILRLQRISAGTRADIPTIQAMEEIWKRVGLDVTDVAKQLERSQRGADELSISLRNAGVLATSGVNVLRGNLGGVIADFAVLRGGANAVLAPVTEVIRGTQIAKVEITDFASALRNIRVDATQYLKASPLDRQIMVARALRARAAAGQGDIAEAASRQLRGKGYAEDAEAINRLADSTDGLKSTKEELRKTGQLVSPQDVGAAREFRDALITAAGAWEGMTKEASVKAFTPAIEGFKTFAATIAAARDPVATEERHQAFIAGQNADVAAAEQIWGAFFNWFHQGWAAAWRRDLPGGGQEAPLPPPTGHAAGGYIRGPGSDTSDSILARLSNGEFVARAAAVRHYGAGFFHALNQQRFETGGLVDAIHARAGPHFAEGGLVGTAASTPVHLHIGGGSYPMAANSGVAAALVGAAKHSQMVSAGIKPAWYGR
jgi:hypothetical protein